MDQNAPVQDGTVYVINSDSMGSGDQALGSRLMGVFLKTAAEVEPRPDTIVFYNAAVKLLAPPSHVLEQLQHLHDAGVDLLACVTCLEYFELTKKIKVGQVSNMREIVQTLTRAKKVITL